MSANRRVECGMAPDEEAAGMPQTESYWISREMILVHSLLDCALMGFFNGRQILQLTPPQLAEPDRHRRRWCRERRVTIGSSSIKASPCPTRLRASRNPGIMKPSSSEFRSRAQRTDPGCSAASPDMGPHTRVLPQAWAFEQATGAVWYYAESNPAMSGMGRRTLDRIRADASPAHVI